MFDWLLTLHKFLNDRFAPKKILSPSVVPPFLSAMNPQERKDYFIRLDKARDEVYKEMAEEKHQKQQEENK